MTTTDIFVQYPRIDEELPDDLDDDFDADVLAGELGDEEDVAVELVVIALSGTAVHADRPVAVDGAERVIVELREAGASVAFTTGLPPAERTALLERLDWRGLADIALSPADAGRERPAPDMVLVASVLAGVSSVENVVVVGDSPLDMQSGVRAGVGAIVGVLTGGHSRAGLLAAGAQNVIDSIADLPHLLGMREGTSRR